MKILCLFIILIKSNSLFASQLCEIKIYKDNSIAVANEDGRQLTTRYRVSWPTYDDLTDLMERGVCKITPAKCSISFIRNVAYVQRNEKPVSVFWRLSRYAFDDLEELIEIGYCKPL